MTDPNHDIVPTLRMFDGVMTGLAADEIERLRKRVAELEADAEAEPTMTGKLTDTTLMQLYTLANRHGYQAFARHAKNLLAPTQQPSGEVTEEQPSLTNPLTPYGMLVRALRIVSGTTLMDMAKALLTTPAKLSAMEFGRTPVTPEFAFDVSAYFDTLGVPHTASALRAAIEAPPLFKRQEES